MPIFWFFSFGGVDDVPNKKIPVDKIYLVRLAAFSFFAKRDNIGAIKYVAPAGIEGSVGFYGREQRNLMAF